MPDVSPFIPAADHLVNGCAIENLGVIRCCGAAHRAYLAAVANGKPNETAESEGAQAYRRAMPPLDSDENIRNFISCVAHAMLIRIIDPAEARSSMPPSVPSRPCANPPPNPPQSIIPRNPRRYVNTPYPLPYQGQFVLSVSRRLKVRRILPRLQGLSDAVDATYGESYFPVPSSPRPIRTTALAQTTTLRFTRDVGVRHEPENGEPMVTQFLTDPEGNAIRTRDAEPMEEPALADAEEEEMAELWAADPGNQGA